MDATTAFDDLVPQPEEADPSSYLDPELSAVRSTTGHEIDPDGVNHPRHYNLHPAGIECIDVIEAMSFNIGSAIKYLWRAGLKPTEAVEKDLDKAIWYVQRERERAARAASAPATGPSDDPPILSPRPDPILHLGPQRTV